MMHPVWKCFQVYVRLDCKKFAILKFRYSAGQHHNTEVRCGGGSPTNLIHHLDTSYLRHQEAFKTLSKSKSDGGAAEALVTRGGGAQTVITTYGTHQKGPAEKDALIHFMVMTKQAFSASPEDAQLLEEVGNNYGRRPCSYNRGLRERLQSKVSHGCGHHELRVVDGEGGPHSHRQRSALARQVYKPRTREHHWYRLQRVEIKRFMVLARSLISRYNKSSQASYLFS